MEIREGDGVKATEGNGVEAREINEGNGGRRDGGWEGEKGDRRKEEQG